ncbi:ThiF family adenylyltransferase [Cohnella panacarvi]|uniref:ThiF family adenylyltransferase n=1 Tax=Cohnella panacarvi TaxID=400776 RepID=UPI00047CE68B|nr:ThiF family adenylyltransferase [Cohnella panacarvi]
MTETMITHEQIDRIVYAATLAPSPHNVQAWRFRYNGKELELLRDPSRQILKELDPTEKEGTIAQGALFENLVLAARQEGFAAYADWYPEGEDRNLTALIRFDRQYNLEPSELYPYIEKRTVNRSKYQRKPVPPAIMTELQEIAKRDGFELIVATDPSQIKEIARLAGEAGRFKFSHEATHRELYEYLRFTSEETAVKRDGLPLEQFFIPPLAARLGKLAMKWPIMRVLNKIGYQRALASTQETELVRSAPAVCLLVSRTGRRTDYLNGGRLVQRLALTATKHQLSLHPHSAIADVIFAQEAGCHTALPDKWRNMIEQFPGRIRELFALEGEAHVVHLFRMGYPGRTLARRSMRRNLEDVLDIVESPELLPDEGQLYREFTVRNFPFIGENDQEKLRKGRIGVAGCGSIGGASLEILARMGAERFLLAEPDAYELNNLNRQHATRQDIGTHKAEVLLSRMRAINPGIKGYILPSGVTEQNVQYFVGSCEVILDGVDVTEPSALQAKVLLHQEAWRQRRPVISGYDIAGTQLVRIYDYRRGKLLPLHGRFDGIDLAALTPLAFLSKVIAPLHLPIEMLPVLESMIRGKQKSIPQMGPTAELYGVLSSWAALDLLVGRPVREKVLVDIPGLLRPSRLTSKLALKRIWGIVKLKRLLQQETRKKGMQQHRSL